MPTHTPQFEIETVAMINGEKLEYDLCAKTRIDYNPKRFLYLGEGYIYKVKGFKQGFGPDDHRYFWKRK